MSIRTGTALSDKFFLQSSGLRDENGVIQEPKPIVVLQLRRYSRGVDNNDDLFTEKQVEVETMGPVSTMTRIPRNSYLIHSSRPAFFFFPEVGQGLQHQFSSMYIPSIPTKTQRFHSWYYYTTFPFLRQHTSSPHHSSVLGVPISLVPTKAYLGGSLSITIKACRLLCKILGIWNRRGGYHPPLGLDRRRLLCFDRGNHSRLSLMSNRLIELASCVNSIIFQMVEHSKQHILLRSMIRRDALCWRRAQREVSYGF